MHFNRWDLWYTWVKFEDIKEEKRRPVLILQEHELFVLSLQVTSRDTKYLSDYQLRDWQSAGLSIESIVDTSRRLQLIHNDFDNRIGALSEYDILNLQFMISR